MFRPTARLVRLLVAVLALYIASLYWAPLLPLGAGLTILFLLAWLLDGLLALAPSRMRAWREHSPIISQGHPLSVALHFTAPAKRGARLRVIEDHPEVFKGADFPMRARVRSAHTITLRYDLLTYERGHYVLGPLWLRSFGPLGLAFKQAVLDVRTELKVYPHVAELSRGDPAIARAMGLETGEHRSRRHYEGSEFTSLREYSPGDDFRLISWKHTAHRGKLILREFEPERRQNVVLMLDLGRMMTNRIGEYTRLDYAVNTCVRLAHVCLEKGDRVGVLGFGQDVRAWLPPKSGHSHLPRVISELADLRAEPFESDYVRAFASFSQKNKRRTLVVLFTEILDPESSQVLLGRIRSIVPQHVPICVTIQDSDLLAAAEAAPESIRDVYRRVIAAELLEEKRKTLGILARSGSQVVHVPAHQMGPATLQRYLEIKKRGTL